MQKPDYLRSRKRRGRWFHTYRRDGREVSLGVHGLHPSDPRVFAAFCKVHADWQEKPPEAKPTHTGTFSWAVDLYTSGNHKWKTDYSETTRKQRLAVYRRYTEAQGDRPLSTITKTDLERALYAKGGFGAITDLKALKPVFAHLKKLGFIPEDPTRGIEIEAPKSDGYPTAGADEIETFMKTWPVGTVERLVFDLGLLTGAARVDLCRIGRRNIEGNLLVFNRHKTGVTSNVPMTAELRAVIARTPDIAPAFILNSFGKPYAAASLGNLYGDAARKAGIDARLHGLRKAFCVYWAEQGMTVHQIAAMAGHTSLAEVERYTKAADRKRIVRAIAEGA